MPNVLIREKTIGLYLPKERSDYLPLTPSNSSKGGEPPLPLALNCKIVNYPMNNTWKTVIKVLAAVLAAIASALGISAAV